MSFIAGYLLGLEEGGGSGIPDWIAKINNASTIAEWTIANGWNILAKLVYDLSIVNISRDFDSLYTKDYYIDKRAEIYPLLMCAYKNDEFMFTSSMCNNSNIGKSSTYMMVEPPYGVRLYKQVDWGYVNDSNVFIPNEIQISLPPQINIPDFEHCTPILSYNIAKRICTYDTLTGNVIKEQIQPNGDYSFGPNMFDDNFFMADLSQREKTLIDFSDACLKYLEEHQN